MATRFLSRTRGIRQVLEGELAETPYPVISFFYKFLKAASNRDRIEASSEQWVMKKGDDVVISRDICTSSKPIENRHRSVAPL